jgi:hypothetical protein
MQLDFGRFKNRTEKSTSMKGNVNMSDESIFYI